MKLSIAGIPLAALLLCGCAENAQPPAPEPAAKAEEAPAAGAAAAEVPLSGMEFGVVSIRGSAVKAGVGGKTPMLVFADEERVSFTGGCNQMTGPYTYEPPEEIQLGGEAGFAGTRMACSPELMEQDQALADALKEAAKILPTDDGKRLVNAEGVELVVLRAATP